ALKAISTQEIWILALHVAKAWNINSVRATAVNILVFIARNAPAGSTSHGVIHEIMAELAAGVGEAVGKFRTRRIERDGRRLQSGCIEENDAALEFESLFGLPVNHAHTGHFACA